MNFAKISYEIKEEILYIGLGYNDKKSMTVLSEDVLIELDRAINLADQDQRDKKIKGLVFFSHKPGVFVAGADINMIVSLKTENEAQAGSEKGQELYNKIEDLPIKTVACVDGVCLGGGLELAMSCDVILAGESPKTMMGLPEVKLGILPGFGGTYRLPKRVGLPNALDMILSGKTVDARKGKKLGLVEETYASQRLIDQAKNYILRPVPKRVGFKDTMENLVTDNFISRKIIFQKARESVLKKTKGFYHAPLKILDLMETGLGKSRTSYLSLESQAFAELCVTEQSKNLIHIFFLTEGAKKYPGVKGTGEVKSVARGAVLGAGTMGGGIAWLFANGGQRPLMKDITKEALELGLKQSSSNFRGALKRRKLSEDEFERRQRSITPTLSFDGFKTVDLVIEAVVEKMEVKKKVFAELETKVRPDTLIVSNTSSLSVTEMSKALESPGRFAGLHFFNPVHLMPLVEIITHDRVAPETVEALYKWVLAVKKTPLIVKDGPGFLVNRILVPYMTEAIYLLEEGVGIEEIDQAVLNFGMPMGPVRLMDEVGIDVMIKVGAIMNEALGEKAKPSELSHRVHELGGYGRKSQKGFYLYNQEGKEISLNPEVQKILPTNKKTMDEVSIQKRVFLPMINEAAIILEEKIVDSPAGVDLGLIYGIGFPPFRGGLLKYADSEGLERIVGAIDELAGTVSKARYETAPLLRRLVQEKRKFYDL